MTNNQPGALALVGSGEYLPEAQSLETELLRLGISRGKSNTYIQIPTAAGKEGDDRLDFWRQRGADQGARIGCEVKYLPVLSREDAHNAQWIEEIKSAGLIYFSGGDPVHLAEVFAADQDYAPGTVVVFGGEKEITTTNVSHDTKVAGVISTNPAYLMNDQCSGIAVALTGRVPCQVQGPVEKGTLLVTSDTPGVAQAIDLDQFTPGCILGKSLETIVDKQVSTIEIVVGRF